METQIARWQRCQHLANLGCFPVSVVASKLLVSRVLPLPTWPGDAPTPGVDTKTPEMLLRAQHVASLCYQLLLLFSDWCTFQILVYIKQGNVTVSTIC